MTDRVSIEQYLSESEIPLRLACITPSGWPIVLSLWYLFEGDNLYCATPGKAKVVSYLEAEARCSFEIASDQPPYCGVRGKATATIEKDRGVEILERLLIRYLGDTEKPLARRLLSREAAEVAIRLEPLTYYSWNFTRRMQESLERPNWKLCPG